MMTQPEGAPEPPITGILREGWGLSAVIGVKPCSHVRQYLPRHLEEAHQLGVLLALRAPAVGQADRKAVDRKSVV